MAVDASSARPAAGIDPSRARIAGAIKQAASTTGTSFEYLLATAKMESNFNPTARASTSSARGLFQFIDQTWLGTVKEAGSQLGYGKYADAISKIARRAIIRSRDPGRAERAIMNCAIILPLLLGDGGRADPIQQFQAHRQDRPPPDRRRTYWRTSRGVWRRGPSWIRRRGQSARFGAFSPNAAAKATVRFFHERTGRAQLLSEVYSVLTQRYASAANSPATRTAMASAGGDAGLRCELRRPGPSRQSLTYLSQLRRCSAWSRAGGRGVSQPAITTVQLQPARPDVPLAVPCRRTRAAGLAGGAGIVGQLFVADLGKVALVTDTKTYPRRSRSICSAIATARSAAEILMVRSASPACRRSGRASPVSP